MAWPRHASYECACCRIIPSKLFLMNRARQAWSVLAGSNCSESLIIQLTEERERERCDGMHFDDPFGFRSTINSSRPTSMVKSHCISCCLAKAKAGRMRRKTVAGLGWSLRVACDNNTKVCACAPRCTSCHWERERERRVFLPFKHSCPQLSSQ